ncbi:MAG TPA: D-2-hydroxyacid dehydrogenase family protein [Herpetosiphon sp.]|uniref:D-isomer specific 2-hydroxyacid dehydrogenase NAD-binding n=1 Tax=Herpetosiphon aurantiacus (strain ATCC 23779 / DSM 785 / 114-95) TaxID=316274 RepID=A9AVH7_HERA2|nr:D-2-hydroxyacid dehydrogenase family protein [Herpetosiphon sp.]ABX04668.1 D-isomer specific 2-hydroxyacid dehydrogenase NAD-binding [Herpetosiphon aurantiacus DSM 785]HBW48616.1 D-2-hydroxyacid dehydrogenase family protein [Herpetosiphon sp.]
MTKLRCAILDDYQHAALAMADWSVVAEQVEVEIFSNYFSEQTALIQAIHDCEIVVIMRERTPFKADLLAQLPNLKLLITSGMRNASIDVAAAQAQGVVVCGTASRSEPPAELTWALILGLARQIVPENLALRTNGPWQQSVGMDLAGQRLGLLGLGKIGSNVAKVAQAFGMDVLAWSQNLTAERTQALGVQLAVSKEQLLEQSDIVSIHLVLGERTHGLIGAAELQRMRRHAYLINTSRAAIVDQAALIQALEQGWIGGAGLDVFEIEPLPAQHPFRSLPNVLATPHLGYVSQRNYKAYFGEAIEDIQAFLAGAPIRQLS